MPKPAPFQRAADAPALPTSTVKFILYCLASFRGLIILMILLETGQAAGGILVPYAIKAIMDGVAHLSGGNVLENLRQPLLLLLGLNIAEILFSRASGAVLIIMGRACVNAPAKRFFNQDFPDLFSWVVGEMGELPLHRNRTKRVRPNPLVNIAVPA